MTSEHLPSTQDVVAHLHRLAFASSAGEVIKELQCLVSRLGPRPPSFELSLGALTALAEGHLCDRPEPTRDALTGLLGARAFSELLRAHARRASASVAGAEPVVVVLTLLDAGALGRDPHAAEVLKITARVCQEQVAADDYLGRVAATSIAVLPRNGGARGAHSVRARLITACRAELANVVPASRLRVDLRDVAGVVRESVEIVIGSQAQVA